MDMYRKFIKIHLILLHVDYIVGGYCSSSDKFIFNRTKAQTLQQH